MSFLITARVMSRACQCKVLTTSLRTFSHQVSLKKISIKALPVTQIRAYSSNNQISTDGLEHIYSGTLRTRIKAVKIFSLGTSVAALLAQLYILPSCLESNGMMETATVAFSFGTFAFLTPLILHLITKRYVINIYYNKPKNSFVATIFTVFLREKSIEFTADEVKQPEVANILTTCVIRNIPLFMDLKNFTEPDYYSIIMGYDKPLDLSLYADEPVEDEKKYKKQ